ncbi:MAG: thioesterase family protein [Polyangia bacterium]
MPFETSVAVRFGDVDHAGILFYPRYYIYLHDCFENFFNESSVGYVDLVDRRRIGFPTVHLESDHKAPMRWGDTLDVTMTVPRLGERSATFHYLGRRHRDGVVAIDAKITIACVDMDTFKALSFPADLRALFGSIAS